MSHMGMVVSHIGTMSKSLSDSHGKVRAIIAYLCKCKHGMDHVAAAVGEVACSLSHCSHQIEEGFSP